MNKILPFLIILLFNLFVSCKHAVPINYPIEPHIEFKNIKTVAGFSDLLGNPAYSLELSLYYTDGDANFGRLSLPDTSVYNCLTIFYKKDNGVFNLVDSDGFFYNPKYFLIPEIKESNKIYRGRDVTVIAKTLYEGEFQINILLVGYHSPFNIGDTLKATVQITDNDDNKSNIAEMEKIYSY